MAIQELLNRIIKNYTPKGIYNLSVLNSGLTKNEINEMIGPLGLKFPDELYQLYMWRNGFNEYKADYNLWPWVSFLSLEESVKDYLEFTKERDPDLFPVFLEHDCDRYFISTKTDNSKGVIYYDCPMITFSAVPISIFDSIETALISHIEV